METITAKPKYWRTATSIKSVNITTKEWFDKTYGNSYFSAQVVINNKYLIKLPFQYGYGDHSIDMVAKKLIELGITDKDVYRWDARKSIDFRYNKIENCLKRNVVSFGHINKNF